MKGPEWTDVLLEAFPLCCAAMGMIHCEYARLEAADLARAVAEPAWAERRLDALATEWTELDLPPDEARYLSIGTAWGALYGLLRASADLPVDVIRGGGALELPVEPRFGPARYLEPVEVRRAADALRATPFDQIAGHYDIAIVCDDDVCPEPAEHADDEPARLRAPYEELTVFFAASADVGDGVVVLLA